MKDILDYLGLPGSIATVFLAIMLMSVQIEKLATASAKADLSHFLKTADWRTLSSRLLHFIHTMFIRLFGPRHLSWRCFLGSAALTLGSLFTLLLLGFINSFEYFRTMPSEVLQRAGFQALFIAWLLCSIFVDCTNLAKTRALIWFVDWSRLPVAVFIPLIIIDLALSLVIFLLAYGYVFSLGAAHSLCVKVHCTVWEEIKWSMHLFPFMSSSDLIVFRLGMIYQGPTSNEIAVFF